MEFEEFELAIYRRPEHPAELDEEALQANRRAHHAYLASLRDAGKIVTNAAVVGHPDDSVMAHVVYCTGSLEEVRHLVSADPAVSAGRFVADVMTLRSQPGTMVRKGRTIEV